MEIKKTTSNRHMQFKGIENDNIKRYSSAHNLQAQKRRSFHVSSTSHPKILQKICMIIMILND